MDIFISYRRHGGIDIARNIWSALRERNYYSFFDLDAIREGEFPEIIYQNITRSDNFVIILTQDSLEKCIASECDWVRRELSAAIRQNKNIVPITCTDFKFPDNLPEDIARIKDIQTITYDGVNFTEAIDKLIIRLKDAKGEALRLSKKRNISNTFYGDGHMSDEERKRIKADYESCRAVEEDVFNRLLKDKNNITLFNPAIYEIDSYMSKYNRQEISNVYGLMNHQSDIDDAAGRYSERGKQKNFFYVGNMEHDGFEDEMDKILSEHSLPSFDMVDLTLILRDLVEPEKKLRQIVDRMTPGGIVYVRELDHGMALAYPDEGDKFKKMFEYIRRDDYSGDYEAGRKVYYWMKNADLMDIHFEARQISTVGLKRRERRILFETLFSYVEREYRVMHEKEPTTYTQSAIEWLQENYKSLEATFSSDDFFYSSGFVEFYGYVE